jgi:two-component system CheB/CheR fusion protein
VSVPLARDARFWQVMATIMVALIFVLDTQTPIGIAVPVFYVVPTIIFVTGSRFAEPLIVAAVATVLTAAGYYVSPSAGDDPSAVANRVIATAVIWAAAALVVGYVRMVERWSRQVSTANESLEASMRRLKDLEYALDQSAIVAATDQTGRITYVNDKFCEISKYSSGELLGQDHRIINSGYHPKDVIRELWRTIAQGRIWRGELRNRAKDGSIYWVDTTIVPFLNERGKPWQYLSIRSDITQRKAAEQQLREEAALTQLGQLSAVVAHEVRNPLAAVKGSLQVLATRIAPEVSGREIIPALIARVDALNNTVTDILTYSRPNPPKMKTVHVGPLLNEVACTVRSAVPSVPIHVSAPAATAVADPEMMRAVLANVVLNAAQASVPVDPAGAGAVSGVELRVETVGDRCTVQVLDRGPGLPDNVRQRLFEPFVTTRAAGTGLGLAIAHRLTGLQGGTLTLDDRPGGGTIATITFPPNAARVS